MYTIIIFLTNIYLFTISIIMNNKYSFYINVINSYMAFTVLHEASHNLVSKNILLNDSIGIISSILVSPLSSFHGFKYIHKNHHNYVNSEEDPDYWISHSDNNIILKSFLQIPYYYNYLIRSYLKNKISIKQQIKNFFQVYIIFIILISLYIFDMKNIISLFLYHLLLPSLISIPLLSYFLVYTPHNNINANEDITSHDIHYKYIPDNILSILMMNQNKHEVHHKNQYLEFYKY